MRKMLAALAGFALVVGSAQGQARAWDPAPWLADVAQMRAAFETKYANREWLEQERGVAIARTFDQLAAQLRTAGSDAEARAILDRAIRGIGDGHVALRWPRPQSATPVMPATAPAPTSVASLCQSIGYDARKGRPGIASALLGYRALVDKGALDAGVVATAGETVGVLRIPVFDPHAFPQLCADAVAALQLPIDKPCDDSCKNAVITHAYAALTRDMATRLGQLQAVGATSLLVDLTGNGGGSEWAEAAARMVTAKRLTSAPVGFVRGPHWAGTWGRLAELLHGWARTAPEAERAKLRALAEKADAARVAAETPCAPDTGCQWLGRAGYATGLVGSAEPGEWLGSEWGAWVFSAGQHAYQEGAWRGPVMVLVDQETWSAAEQFTALLQDARVATIVGARTGGAGCGYTWGGTPTTLNHSGATLLLPDCARFRADGSNEVAGIVPDVTIGWRATDSVAFRSRLLNAALPAAVARAQALHGDR
ncbi:MULTISPECIES: S41 family peptidase [unclassified Sphingomonas]|uniref:S41 family peptidase n=1 Tax=unclassified Sphingomonas TaxID=196159 RepID=UPI00215183EA|nr:MULTISPECIES: S41 family peptidase [unclassified Sphingomonas]MCR5871510.1 S41 family peptidase [Sphingomonas sp. J344]UUY00195.1 S41 family peptidase [Sphingomonas sp. J315]